MLFGVKFSLFISPGYCKFCQDWIVELHLTSLTRHKDCCFYKTAPQSDAYRYREKINFRVRKKPDLRGGSYEDLFQRYELFPPPPRQKILAGSGHGLLPDRALFARSG
jgi:hypothetical protein